MTLFFLASALGAAAAVEFQGIPGGEGTKCGRGADYKFYFREGTSNNLVIDFEGGGGCWDTLTCLLPTWQTTVGGEPGNSGIVDPYNEENPTAGWNYLYVPYCTGDVHLGNKNAVGVNFNGRLNSQAALDWVYDKVKEPETVLVTGCSAGALGSVGWAPYISQHYRQSRHVHFSDSFIGLTSPNHWSTLERNWDLLSAFYPDIPGMDMERLRQCSDREDGECDICPHIVSSQARAFPADTYSHFTFDEDSVQIAFSLLAGGPTGAKWTQVMRDIIPALASVPNSGYFIAKGTGHCTIPSSTLYSTSAGDTRLISWLSAIVRGEDYPQVVDYANPVAGNATAPTPTAAERQAAFKAMTLAAPRDSMECAWAFSEHYDSLGLPRPEVDPTPEEVDKIIQLYKEFDCGRGLL